jgi:uncharacterized protein YxjI/predicted RNA-binding Zn-ribbon protein involved in translation (DUF1610 family)
MGAGMKCPKCGFVSDTASDDCPKCGVIISKFLSREKERKAFEGQRGAGKDLAQQPLAGAQTLMIRQQKEWGEILSGFETRNKYDVIDTSGNAVFKAEEVSGGLATLITRVFLQAFRPFTMHIFSPDGNEIFRLKRPLRFFFHKLEVYQSNGTLLGAVERRFALMRRIYSVQDPNGNETFELFGPILHPWTFQIRKHGAEVGKITKKWSGLAKETFTVADNFGITFPQGLDANQKAIFLGALFLIDFVHFEKKN